MGGPGAELIGDNWSEEKMRGEDGEPGQAGTQHRPQVEVSDTPCRPETSTCPGT